MLVALFLQIMLAKLRWASMAVFLLLSVLSSFYIFQLKFAFDFEQFFPEGDEDLEFFRDFIAEFETDDNFLIIAVANKEGVFQEEFLNNFHDLTLKTRKLPYVMQSTSLTTFSYPLKTPFAITSIPAIHIDKPEKYERDREKILSDERFVYNLISPDGKSMTILLKTKENIGLEESEELIVALEEMVNAFEFDAFHLLGRAYFQKELVAMQKREVIVSGIVSSILVIIIMFLIFQRFWGIAIALISIGVGMLLFFGLLAFLGRELSAISALYPVLMIIVGTSDVIHIMTKYIKELEAGKTRKVAITLTIKEIGLATLLTSITTAIGFGSLMSSKIYPIKDFGVNAAIGVMVAYITVLFLTTALLTFFSRDQLTAYGSNQKIWDRFMAWFYLFTKNNPRRITIGGLGIFVISLIGISQIQTNYAIINNMPSGKKITEDFKFFEKNFTGFRPMEFAVFAEGENKVTDYPILKQIHEVEEHLKEYPSIRAVTSLTTLYKSINQMENGNRNKAYTFPKDEKKFNKYKKLTSKLPSNQFNVLVNKDETKARISSRILDIGADTIKQMGIDIDNWIVANTDPSKISFKRTGTGLIIDKNAAYVRRSLLLGLGGAILIVSFLMALIFKDIKMVLVSLIPNLFPLVLAGAMLGFLGIDLEAGVAIVFAVIFGIAVDDTIHFLSKYKLSRRNGLDMEAAIEVSFMETGKAICLTSVILFFGFLVMLFSIHPPSVSIGLLISLTLFSALLSDLFLMPVLIRWLKAD